MEVLATTEIVRCTSVRNSYHTSTGGGSEVFEVQYKETFVTSKIRREMNVLNRRPTRSCIACEIYYKFVRD